MSTENDLIYVFENSLYFFFPFPVGLVNVTWQLSVAVFMDATCDGITGTVFLSLPQMSQSLKVPIKLSQGLQKVSLPVMRFTEKDEIKPWWPNGYGKPNLYALKVKKPVIRRAMLLMTTSQ